MNQKGGWLAEWSWVSVSHPAVVQDGGFDSRRRPDTRRSLPPGASVNLTRYLYVEILYMRNERIQAIWAKNCWIVDPPENPNNYYYYEPESMLACFNF